MQTKGKRFNLLFFLSEGVMPLNVKLWHVMPVHYAFIPVLCNSISCYAFMIVVYSRYLTVFHIIHHVLNIFKLSTLLFMPIPLHGMFKTRCTKFSTFELGSYTVHIFVLDKEPSFMCRIGAKFTLQYDL